MPGHLIQFGAKKSQRRSEIAQTRILRIQNLPSQNAKCLGRGIITDRNIAERLAAQQRREIKESVRSLTLSHSWPCILLLNKSSQYIFVAGKH